jgi:threonine aldolase
MKRYFASDNNSGVHPKFLKAMSEVNLGHEIGYGEDPYTDEAKAAFRKTFGEDTEVFFTFLGTGANVLGLNAMTNTFNSIICAETAHIFEDECGAVERFTGAKLIPIETDNGKLTVEKIRPHVKGVGFEHHSQPKVISITQVTEMGTVYTVDEIKAITNYAHQNNMFVHMDGARISNAAVSLNLPFKAFTKDAGIDVLSFGGTKNGMMYGEAVVFFNTGLTENFKYIRKQGMQLASKMRYISAQFTCFLENDFWKDLASHSNEMAQKLKKEVDKLDFVALSLPVEANGLFVKIPKQIANALQKKFFFYDWNEDEELYRWMCSWDTQEEDIDNFISALKEIV